MRRYYIDYMGEVFKGKYFDTPYDALDWLNEIIYPKLDEEERKLMDEWSVVGML